MRGRKGIFDCASSEDGATRHWYNGQHQRVLKDEPTGQTVYAYGTAGHNVLGEYRQAAGAGAVQSTEHIYLPTASGPMPVATVIGGQHFAVHADHLNTPRRLTDSAHRVRWQWVYSGYGETAAQALALPSVANVAYNLRYPGQVDDGNGLFYNWHHFYHPASGRYVSADPIGLEGGGIGLRMWAGIRFQILIRWVWTPWLS
jgi:RHS repeat-associated protein